MSNLRAKFGARLRTLRRNAGMTQEEFVEAAGISVVFLSLVGRGVDAPSFEYLRKLAEALDVSGS